MTKTTTIYALIDPRDHTYHYVGKTVQNPPQKRLRQHLSRLGEDELARWINELDQEGLKPTYRILEVVSPDADWRAAEIYWIRYGLAQGWELKNKASGGDNYPLELLARAGDDDLIPRTLYATEQTLTRLTSINCFVMKGKPAEDNTFRDLLDKALRLIGTEEETQRNLLEQDFLTHILTHGIIQVGRGWRVPIMKKLNLDGGAFLAVGSPFAINGLSIPGNWDQDGWRTTIKLYKRTSEMLDVLATRAVNAQRCGYDRVLQHMLNAMATLFDKIVKM